MGKSIKCDPMLIWDAEHLIDGACAHQGRTLLTRYTSIEKLSHSVRYKAFAVKSFPDVERELQEFVRDRRSKRALQKFKRSS